MVEISTLRKSELDLNIEILKKCLYTWNKRIVPSDIVAMAMFNFLLNSYVYYSTAVHWVLLLVRNSACYLPNFNVNTILKCLHGILYLISRPMLFCKALFDDSILALVSENDCMKAMKATSDSDFLLLFISIVSLIRSRYITQGKEIFN